MEERSGETIFHEIERSLLSSNSHLMIRVISEQFSFAAFHPEKRASLTKVFWTNKILQFILAKIEVQRVKKAL